MANITGLGATYPYDNISNVQKSAKEADDIYDLDLEITTGSKSPTAFGDNVRVRLFY